MRLSNEEILQEKIDLAEQESNDLWKIRWEKLKYNLSQFFKEKDWCEKHKMQYQEHGFEGFKHCPECRREFHSR